MSNMSKEVIKLKEWCENTNKYLSTCSDLLGEISEPMANSILPPLKVLKFYKNQMEGLLSKDEPKRANIGDGDQMYTIPDNVVSIKTAPKRPERWSSSGQVRLLELD